MTSSIYSAVFRVRRTSIFATPSKRNAWLSLPFKLYLVTLFQIFHCPFRMFPRCSKPCNHDLAFPIDFKTISGNILQHFLPKNNAYGHVKLLLFLPATQSFPELAQCLPKPVNRSTCMGWWGIAKRREFDCN